MLEDNQATMMGKKELDETRKKKINMKKLLKNVKQRALNNDKNNK
jgi:hypothetical protein